MSSSDEFFLLPCTAPFLASKWPDIKTGELLIILENI